MQIYWTKKKCHSYKASKEIYSVSSFRHFVSLDCQKSKNLSQHTCSASCSTVCISVIPLILCTIYHPVLPARWCLYLWHILVLGTSLLQCLVGGLVVGQGTCAPVQQVFGSRWVPHVVSQRVTQFQVLIWCHTAFQFLKTSHQNASMTNSASNTLMAGPCLMLYCIAFQFLNTPHQNACMTNSASNILLLCPHPSLLGPQVSGNKKCKHDKLCWQHVTFKPLTYSTGHSHFCKQQHHHYPPQKKQQLMHDMPGMQDISWKTIQYVTWCHMLLRLVS